MYDDSLVAYHRCELEDDEDACRKNASEVQDDASLVPVEGTVPVAFSRGSTNHACGPAGGTENTTEVEVHQAR